MLQVRAGEPVKSNCLIFAVRLLLRLRGKGYRLYFTLRWSDHGPFPHVLVGRLRADGRAQLVSYKPKHPIKRRCPPPLFEGKVVWGDKIVLPQQV